MVTKKKITVLENTTSSNTRLEYSKQLYKIFEQTPIPSQHILFNLGLYLKSSQLSKILYINELYQKILHIPGVIMEFGTWYGQNLVLCENLRAIYEPFNVYRRIIGFDTFAGYTKLSKKDIKSDVIKEGNYTVGKDYPKYLEELLEFHQKNNVLFTKNKHQIIKGDVSITLPRFLKKHSETVIALAYLDLALYEPTRQVLLSIKNHLIKGSIIAFDELNSPEYPGETLALLETWGLKSYKIFNPQFAAGRSYMIIE